MSSGETYISVFLIFYTLTSASPLENYCSSTQLPSYFECFLTVAALDRWPGVIPINASYLKILLKFNFSLDTVECRDIKLPLFPNVEKLVIIIVGEPTNLSPTTGDRISEFSSHSGDNSIINIVKSLLSLFPNLSSFSITNKSRTIANFRMPFFQHSIKLESLSISNFRGVLHSSPAFNETGNLRSLELDNNDIMKLDFDTFEACCQNSSYLSLQRNDIETVNHPNRLKGLDGLRTLDMSLNKLRNIKEHNFLNRMSHLKNLFLSKNLIVFISPNAFVGMNFLELLDLSGNLLENVPEFNFFCHLKSLLVHTNVIETFSTSSIQALIHLEELDLSSNFLKMFNMGAMHIFKELKSTRLSNNRISLIDFNGELKNFKIENLHLNGNKLLNLHNVLSWVRTKATNVKVLDISGNQWSDCEVLFKWIFNDTSLSTDLEFDESVFIDSHQDYSGRWVLDVRMPERINSNGSIKLLNWNQISCLSEFFKIYNLEDRHRTSSATTNPSSHSSPLTSSEIALRLNANTFSFNTLPILTEQSQSNKSVAASNSSMAEEDINSTSTNSSHLLDETHRTPRYYVVLVIVFVSISLSAMTGVLLVRRKRKNGEYNVINENVSTPDLLTSTNINYTTP